MKQEPISCRADNALAARWACLLKRPIFYLATYIDNNNKLMLGDKVIKNQTWLKPF